MSSSSTVDGNVRNTISINEDGDIILKPAGATTVAVDQPLDDDVDVATKIREFCHSRSQPQPGDEPKPKKAKTVAEFRKEDPFEKLLNRRVCSCGNSECKNLLKQYYEDPHAPYPMGRTEPQLLIWVSNPRVKSPSGKGRVRELRQKYYDRVVVLLDVSSPDKRKGISVGIHHFRREVIEHYYMNPHRGETKFIDYLLPPDLVGKDKYGELNLGREFSSDDIIDCIGTRSKVCKKEGACRCNLFMNVPFVKVDEAKSFLGQKVSVHFPLPTAELKGLPTKKSKLPMFEVTVPPGVAHPASFSLLADGHLATVKCPPNIEPGQKIQFHLSTSDDAVNGATDAVAAAVCNGTGAKLCRSCKQYKQKEDYNASQWHKKSGQPECKQCQQIELLRVSESYKSQIRILGADNFNMKEKYQALLEEKNTAVRNLRLVEIKLEKSTKKVKALQATVRRCKKKLERQKENEEKRQRMMPAASKQQMLATNQTKKSRGAKVKARMNPDGSFMPVHTPRALADGTYARPSGGQPKGMKWDALRGCWVLAEAPAESVEQDADGEEQQEEEEEEEEHGDVLCEEEEEEEDCNIFDEEEEEESGADENGYG